MNFLNKRLTLVVAGIFMTPVSTDAAPVSPYRSTGQAEHGTGCTERDLHGRYAVMIAGERSGYWQRCTVRVSAEGIAIGRCLGPTGALGPFGPIRFFVKPNCRVTAESPRGDYGYSARIQSHKRGLIGRFFFDYEGHHYRGPVVAVKRGK